MDSCSTVTADVAATITENEAEYELVESPPANIALHASVACSGYRLRESIAGTLADLDFTTSGVATGHCPTLATAISN
jgi:hypothetical protein